MPRARGQPPGPSPLSPAGLSTELICQAPLQAWLLRSETHPSGAASRPGASPPPPGPNRLIDQCNSGGPVWPVYGLSLRPASMGHLVPGCQRFADEKEGCIHRLSCGLWLWFVSPLFLAVSLPLSSCSLPCSLFLKLNRDVEGRAELEEDAPAHGFSWGPPGG